MKIAILYDTKRGSTAKIVGYMADEIRKAGHEVDVCNVKDHCKVENYDVVVVGSPVYYESPLKSVVGWLKDHADALEDKRVCLFVVCMAQKFGHPFKSYVYKRYLGILRKALGKEPTCQGDITGYIFKESPQTREDARAFATAILEHLQDI